MAADGAQALEAMRKYHPDIAIFDVKMPIMDGLTVIGKAREEGISTEVIVFSGYDDFEYAQKALQYGVKQYLLKPTDETEIINALKSILKEIREKEGISRMQEMLQSNFENMIPIVRQQFIRDLVFGMSYAKKEFEYYKDLLGIEDDTMTLLAVVSMEEYNLRDVTALSEMCSMFLGRLSVQYVLIIERSVLVFIKEQDKATIENEVIKLKSQVEAVFQKGIVVAASNPGLLIDGEEMYGQCKECINCNFYMEELPVIFFSYISAYGQKSSVTRSEEDIYDKLFYAVKSGNTENSENIAEEFFREISERKEDISTVKVKCVQLCLRLVTDFKEKNDEEISRISKNIFDSEKLVLIEKLIKTYIKELTVKFGVEKSMNSESRVEEIKKYVDENFCNEEISVQFMAERIFFMTPNYMGVLFKQKMGISIGRYIQQKRIEKAKRLLGGELKIYEVAQKCGFGDNPQYFSQVFKNETGVLPGKYGKNEE